MAAAVEPCAWSGRFGAWRATALECGRFALDGGAMFGSVPRVLWERLLPPDSLHRVPLALRVLLLENEALGAVVLVDAGIGAKEDARFCEMFAVENPPAAEGEVPLAAALAPAGVTLSDVTHVVLTHLHFDHCGGATRLCGGAAEPTIRAARHFVQRANWEVARAPGPRERASYLEANVRPLAKAPLELVAGERELLPGLTVIPTRGHTAGMQVVRVEGDGRVLYYVADLAPTRHHVRIPYTMGYDLCVRDILEEKERLWRRALDEEAVLVFEHDREVRAGTLERRDGKYRLRPLAAE